MVVTFDVNETLLDLAALDGLFERIFGDPAVRVEWFGTVLRNAMAITITGDRSDFVTIGGASLQMVADRHGVRLDATDRNAVGGAMTSLPAHDDVEPALRRLHGSGLRLAALTNSPQDAAVSQLTNAGIAGLFDEIMSVEATGRFKPAREVYQSAAARLGVDTSDMVMVAAHDWDVAGAMRAGCRGAYLMRPGTALNPLYPEPDFVASDLDRLAGMLIAASA